MARFELAAGRWLEVEEYGGDYYLRVLKAYERDETGTTVQICIPRALAPQVAAELWPEGEDCFREIEDCLSHPFVGSSHENLVREARGLAQKALAQLKPSAGGGGT